MRRAYRVLYETIKTDLKDEILTVFLNRPSQLNAYTHQMGAELIEVFKEAP